DPARFHWNGDAIGPGSQTDGAFGIVVKNRIGRPVWARIVAPGYVPQPITEKPIVLAEDSVLDKFEVKMHRGKELSGRVVDSEGGELSTLYDLDFITTGRKGWEMLRAYQFSLNSKDGKLTIANHTPGQYELVRRRRVKVGDYDGEFKLADVKLRVDPSNTF